MNPIKMNNEQRQLPPEITAKIREFMAENDQLNLSIGGWFYAGYQTAKAETTPVFNEHDQGIIKDLEVMAADKKNGFWPQALANAALRLINRPMAPLLVVKGMKISMDVSTGDEDAGNRIFGRVEEIMLKEHGTPEDIALAVEESRNFDKPSLTAGERKTVQEGLKHLRNTCSAPFCDEFAALLARVLP